MSSALELLAASPYCTSIEKIFGIGGGEIFRDALNAPECEAIHITKIHTSFECDTFMPLIDFATFRPREFLNTVVTDIIHLQNQKLTTYKGNYDTFERTREEQIKNQQKAVEAHERSRAHMQTLTAASSPSTHILGSTRAPFLASTDLCKVKQENKHSRVRKDNFEHDLNGNYTAAYECYQKAFDISPVIA
ncbi:hypothetical protein KIW84_044635 [Lathyrus oleraceus]|uniref:dihydrofolate reductase n=1 Tax=Pisum sativum TaxID=3888 RepID=A0A9D4XLI5_PEA|nr:hypothetical protein KIW84_044635 [Pisum sativum]